MRAMRDDVLAQSRRGARRFILFVGAAALGSCFDPSTRWEPPPPPPPPPPPICIAGQERCTTAFERCVTTEDGGVAWSVVDDCAAKGKVCAPTLLKCTTCLPSAQQCLGQDAVSCSDDGEEATLI